MVQGAETLTRNHAKAKADALSTISKYQDNVHTL